MTRRFMVIAVLIVYGVGISLATLAVMGLGTVRHGVVVQADTGVLTLPVVTRHAGGVHIVMDDGTLIVVRPDTCVYVVPADATDATCLPEVAP